MINRMPIEMRIAKLRFEYVVDKDFYTFSCIDTLNHCHKLYGNNDNESGKFIIDNYEDVDLISRIETEDYINTKIMMLAH